MKVLKKKIIVLTPVKNEDWILDRFLAVCSIFADHIIIADQQSSDDSRNICAKYEKVILLDNNSDNFNEAERQLLLLNTARELFGNNHILLAIDADEILSANSLASKEWEKIQLSKPGSVLYFEKPSLYKNTKTVIRIKGVGWPLGYVDDGTEHKPEKIHSTRIPNPINSEKVYFEEIKFVHYNSVRLDAFASKQRMYSMLENIYKTKKLRHRLRMYDVNINLIGPEDYCESSKDEWFKGWEDLGIDMHTIPTSKYYWYDYEALKLFQQFGLERFVYDDIWNFDWESFRKHALAENYKFCPAFEIKNPRPIPHFIIKNTVKIMNNIFLTMKQRFSSLKFEYNKN